MKLTDFRVKALIYPKGEYWLGKAADVIDEGYYYRVDGTHIFDKHGILDIIYEDGLVTLKMKDKTVKMKVEEKNHKL